LTAIGYLYEELKSVLWLCCIYKTTTSETFSYAN
jgi:hypothetical protein